ncbi:hypothetical protein KR018_003638, partial [Drosophila ironensis]
VRHGPKNQLLCQCGRYYNTMSRLMLHQREECQDFKRFQCDFCLKWFKRRSHLNRHKKLHDAELLLEPIQKPSKPTREKTSSSAAAKQVQDNVVAATVPLETDLEPLLLYTSEIKKYNLRTHDSSSSVTSQQDYPSTSRQRNRRSAAETVEVKSENDEPAAGEDKGSAKGLRTKATAQQPSSDAMIALQQLASISTARSLQHLVQNMGGIMDTNSLILGPKLPRQTSKRSPTYESNRCPLCARVYRTQAFLNEHMRKEHSVLI